MLMKSAVFWGITRRRVVTHTLSSPTLYNATNNSNHSFFDYAEHEGSNLLRNVGSNLPLGRAFIPEGGNLHRQRYEILKSRARML
jgi:hypothetical protein